MFGSPKATWKINRYGFWYGMLFRLVDVIVYFKLAALSVSVRPVTMHMRRTTWCTSCGYTTRWNWQRCKLKINNSTNQVDQHFFKNTKVTLCVPKSISINFSVLKWKIEFWRVRQVPLELRNIKNIYFSVHSSYVTQYVMLTTICLWEETVCGVMYPSPHVLYDQALNIFTNQDILEGK